MGCKIWVANFLKFTFHLPRLFEIPSNGRQCLMVGMIDLYTFVDMLEHDWNTVMKGIPICYGADTGKNIGQTLGLGKKRKRSNYVNNGRPPDTTDNLVNGNQNRKSRAGWPPNLRNHNRNLWAAYPLS